MKKFEESKHKISMVSEVKRKIGAFEYEICFYHNPSNYKRKVVLKCRRGQSSTGAKDLQGNNTHIASLQLLLLRKISIKFKLSEWEEATISDSTTNEQRMSSNKFYGSGKSGLQNM